MSVNINGVDVKVYKLSSSVEKHDFRERVKDKDGSYVLLEELEAQPYWYSYNEIRFKEEIHRFYSVGYFVFRASDLERLGISPAPDSTSWAEYRIAPYVNSGYSTKLFDVQHVKPESPLNGSYQLYYVYVDEVKGQSEMPVIEVPEEEEETADIQEVTEVLIEHA